MRHRVLLVMCALALGTMASVAEAAVGNIRYNNSVPGDARCVSGESSVTGTALALVPGGKAGFPTVPVLLVTSCVRSIEGGNQIALFFTDPFPFGGEGDPEAVKTLVTGFPSTATAASKPTNGWEALVLRADKGDLLACGTNGTKTVLWSIDFSPFNTIADGTATFLRNGPTGSRCGSIAWDPSDSTVYQTPASGFSVFHSKNDGTALPPIVVPSTGGGAVCTTAITGLGIAGTSLFVACAGTSGEVIQAPTVAQLYKVNGSFVRSFPFSCDECAVPLTLYGVPDDPATFAPEFNELLWTMTANRRFVGFEMAGGTLGQKTGMPALLPGSCPDSVGGNVDSDGDGLLDCWKNGALWSDGKPGINYAGIYGTVALPASNTTRDVTLCVTNPPAAFNQDTDCAKPGRKDLFLEIDYMDFHKPDINTLPLSAVDLVVKMFKNAPVNFPTGVSLHVQVDDLVTVNGKNHYTNVAFVPCTPAASPSDTTTVDFDAVKKLFFGTSAERASLAAKPNALNAKALVFRYALMAHNLLGLGTTSGCAEIGGNDLVVSTGSWGSRVPTGKTVAHNVGTLDQLSGTLGHEFGHTVGLRHGGGDSMNCKPNYVSIMNYNLQFLTPTQRILDYSGQTLSPLDKTSLNENLGVGGPLIPPRTIAFGPVLPLKQPFLATTDGGPINWDPSSTDNDTNETSLSLDLSQTTNATGGCPANQKGALPDNDGGRYYNGFNDWENLQYSFRTSVDFADGGHITSGETALTDPQTDTTPGITFETAAAFSSDATLITVDLKSGGANNKVHQNSNQDVEVAIFSGPGFDATMISPATVLLQGDGWAVPVRQKGNGEFECDVKKVDKDSLQDLVCKFKIPKHTIGAGETVFLITGATSDGTPVGGTTPITVQP